MQQGTHVARAIAARLAGRAVPPFRYRNKGSLAVIGRAAAVADLGERMRFSGYPAWLLWLFVHILYLVEYENRVLVFIRWAISYFTRGRGARLKALAAKLRALPVPVVGRVAGDALLLDLRCLEDEAGFLAQFGEAKP